VIKRQQHTVAASFAAWRFWLIVIVLLAMAAALIGRLLILQVIDSDRGAEFLQSQGDARAVRNEVIPAHRGMIMDRNGEPLAVSTPVASIWVNPKVLKNYPEKIPELAKALQIPRDELQKKIKQSSGQFLYVKRLLPPADAEQIVELGIPGVHMQREYRRFYPAGETVAHLVGYTNIDDEGQEGIELAYDKWLTGKAGSQRVLKNLKGQTIRDLNEVEPAQPGRDVILSIDMRLQDIAYREIKAAMQEHNAAGVSVVLLDVASGEVLAMVNQPSFNPNNRATMKPGTSRNRAMTDMFEPGSTMKAVTAVAALESGKFTSHTLIDTSPGAIRIADKVFRDPHSYGVLDLAHVVAKSSQVGTSKIALELDEQKVWETFKRFGFGRSTETGFPGEASGVMPYKKKWWLTEKVNFTFGYGLSATPLQVAQAYNVFANDGVFKPVSLLRRNEPVEAKQVVKPSIIRDVRRMLELVAEEGTAKKAQIPGFRVAGKTGTIHKISASGGYAEKNYAAWFAGYAPASNPQVVAVIIVDEPSNGLYKGGAVAAPIFARIMSGVVRVLGTVPDNLQPVTTIAENAVLRSTSFGKGPV
jgi:cell division protein FtsI (penicillin-binding protein 3)